MKLIKKFFDIFSPLEVVVLLIAIVISTIILLPSGSSATPGYVLIFADQQIYSVNGGVSISPFNTEFYVAYEDINDKTDNTIREIMNEYLVPYHKLFDRHHDYFLVDPVSPRNPTAEEVATLPRLINLKYINEHKNSDLEVEKPLYDLLLTSKEYSLNTPQNAFNMFIGGVYDFWVDLGISAESYLVGLDPLNNSESAARLSELQSYLPLSSEEINNTLKLWSEDEKYYVRFNDFKNGGTNLSISVGAVAKGMMLDILTNTLFSKGYNKGHVNGGQSSYGFLGKGPYGNDFKIKMTRIDENEDESSEQYAYQFSRPGAYQMSTSGIYAGKSFLHNGQKVIRSHIINPLTGYPTQKEQYITNIVSNTLSGEELDYLTTTLTILSIEYGVEFLRDNYPEDDVQLAYVCVDEGDYYIRRSASFPGGEKASFMVQKEYGDFFLDLL